MKNSNNRTEIDNNPIKLLGYAFLFACLTYSLKVIVSEIGLSRLESIVSAGVYIGWLFLLSNYIVRNTIILKRIIVSEIIYCCILLFNMMLFRDSITHMKENFVYIRQIIIVYIPCGASISCVSEFKNWELKLRPSAILASLVMLVSWIAGYAERWTAQLYGAQLVPFFLIMFCCFLKTHSSIDLLFMIVDFLLLLNGGRQSLIIALLGCVTIYIQNNISNRKRIFHLITFILLIFSVFVFYDAFMALLSVISDFLGIRSRSINMLINGQFNDTSTRNVIYKTCNAGVAKQGSRITGLFGDRVYLYSVTDWMRYPHSFYYEVLLDFGVVGGGIILVLFIMFMVKKLIKLKNEKKLIFSILLVITMVRLLVSSSFMIEGNFYILMTFALWECSIKSKEKRYNNESRNIDISCS